MADPFTPKFVDLVRNYTTTTGTGDFKLSAAVNGYTGLTAALQVGDTFYYSAIGVDKPAEREVGRGTLLANGVVKREPIGGAKTNFTNGTKSIALIAAAEWYNMAQGALAGAPRAVATRTELAALTQWNSAALLTEYGREGTFAFDASNLSAAVAGDSAQGVYIAPASDPTGAAGAWVRKHDGDLRPEWFGAKGDGVSDDSTALGGVSALINALAGGAIALRAGATYVVGGQTLSPGHQSAGYAFPPNVGYPIDLNGCAKGVVVEGNGAVIRCKAGAKYGTFNDDGTNKGTIAPVYTGGLATPYYAMIRATGCSGGVRIENLELDGNIASANIGGEYDANGRQIPCTGIMIDSNTSQVVVSNVRSHHHGLDGIQAMWPGCAENDPRYPIEINDCDFISNGRQGFSWVGGKAVTASNCRFNDTGKNIGTMSYSSPGAGLDIEAEASICREGHFINCEFSNNSGAGAQSFGDTADVVFDHCKFVGTTNASYYGNGSDKAYRFVGCTFTGQLVNVYPNADRALATQFHHCNFLFGTARSPTGQVYKGSNPTGYFLDLGGYGQQNILFNTCQFDTEGNTTIALGYFNDGTALIHNCEMVQDGTAESVVSAVYSGNNKLTTAGQFNGAFATNYGRWAVNGGEVASRLAGGGNVYGDFGIKGVVKIGGAFDGAAPVDGKDLFVTNSTGYGLRLAMNGATSQCYFQAIKPFVGLTDMYIQAVNARFDSGNVIASGTITGSNLSGTNTGDQFTAVAQNTIVGRVAAGTGAASALTTLPAAALPAMTGGDVTSAAGSTTLTIGAGSVSYAKMQQSAASKLLGNPTGSTANVQEIGLAGGLSFSGTTLTLGAITPTSVAATGAITSSSASAKIGYATGSGNSAVQATSKSTGVSFNAVGGQITMNAASLAANAAASFTFTNTSIGANDEVKVWIKSGAATGGAYLAAVDQVAAGSCRISLRNLTAAALAEAVVIGFAVRSVSLT